MSPEIVERLVWALAAFVAGAVAALLIVGLLRILKDRRQRSYQDQVSHGERGGREPDDRTGT